MIRVSESLRLLLKTGRNNCRRSGRDNVVNHREALLSFYDFPGEHWVHLRTTNPIESTFATVRLRTDKVRGCFSRETVLTMVFRLAQCAEKTWRRLNGSPLLADVLAGIRYIDGVHPNRIAA